MVDRIDKLDPGLYRVHEGHEDGRGKQDAHPEEDEKRDSKEKDKFAQGRSALEKLITDPKIPFSAQWSRPKDISSPRILEAREASGGEQEKSENTGPEETSVTMSQRFLVLSGVMDMEGKPRMPVIVTYAVVISVMVASAIMILGILWR